MHSSVQASPMSTFESKTHTGRGHGLLSRHITHHAAATTQGFGTSAYDRGCPALREDVYAFLQPYRPPEPFFPRAMAKPEVHLLVSPKSLSSSGKVLTRSRF